MNSFGRIYRFTSFGESHGRAIGGIIDGIEPGLEIDMDKVQAQLDRRRPGQSDITSARNECDKVDILSGMFEGKTTGTPIGFIIPNTDHRSSDYDNLRNVLRPSHADFTYQAKYGIRDYRGGGRASARETAARIVAGAFASQALAKHGISIHSFTSQIGSIKLSIPYDRLDLSLIDSNEVRCPDRSTAQKMISLIKEVKTDGDTIGGIVSCVIKGVPAGLGEPVFGKLQSLLASAMLSINAAKGFEYGMGFEGASHRGSEMLDTWAPDPNSTRTPKICAESNHSGGIQGGISNGEDIYFSVAFKPVATLMREVPTVTSDGEATTLKAKGRHDPCVVPRAVPIVDAMAAMVVYDALRIMK